MWDACTARPSGVPFPNDKEGELPAEGKFRESELGTGLEGGFADDDLANHKGGGHFRPRNGHFRPGSGDGSPRTWRSQRYFQAPNSA